MEIDYFLLTLMLVKVWIHLGKSDCGLYMDCASCSMAFDRDENADCLWCPLDRRCHKKWSLQTPCLFSMNVADQADCPSEEYGDYDKENAYRATLLSAAAYYGNPQHCLDSIAPSEGVDVKNVIVAKCDDYIFDYEACVAFVGISTIKKEIYVVFRGTQHPEQLFDQVLVAITNAGADSDIGGKVQAYFDNVYTEMYPCVRASVESLMQQYPTYSVLVTGHSLGGAVASLTAASLIHDGTVLKSKLDLYTLGMPRVGDKDYAYYHDKVLMSSWNVVHFRDIIPHTPFCFPLLGCNYPLNMPFQHRTEVYYPSMTSGKDSAFVVCHENEDETCSNGTITADLDDVDITEYMGFHKNYFGLNVGLHCVNTVGPSENIWKDQPNATCSKITSGGPILKIMSMMHIFTGIAMLLVTF